MEIVNGGVHVTGTRSGVQTKKRLKEIVRDSPHSLIFYSTSDIGPQFEGPLTNLPLERQLLVVGPNPYTTRTWYATIYRAGDRIKIR